MTRHPLPDDAAGRAMLTRRAMSLHFVLAQDHIEKLLAEGHADAARIELDGLREAAKVLEGRIGSAAERVEGA